MAQAGRAATRLLRRMGLGAHTKALVAGAALVAALCAAALLRAPEQSFQIERDGGAETAREEQETPSDEAAETGDGNAAQGQAAGPNAEKPDEQETPARIVVHVDGAVGMPGVYALDEGARVNDAIAAAGGLAAESDTSSLNLAAPLADGAKVYVPKAGEELPGQVGAGTATDASGGASAAGGAAATGPVNINTAGAEELCTLPGIGQSTAAAIIEDREKNGAFATVEDLMRVSGIGEKKFARLEGLVCV